MSHVKIAEKIHALVEKLLVEETKFNEGNHSAGTLARKLLQEIKHVAGDGRKLIQDSKKSA